MAILPPNPETYTLDTIFGIDQNGKEVGLIPNLINLATDIAGGVAIIFLLIGAFEYLTAFGNEEKANKGKTTIMWAVIGIVVILLSRLIIALLTQSLK